MLVELVVVPTENSRRNMVNIQNMEGTICVCVRVHVRVCVCVCVLSSLVNQLYFPVPK